MYLYNNKCLRVNINTIDLVIYLTWFPLFPQLPALSSEFQVSWIILRIQSWTATNHFFLLVKECVYFILLYMML